MINYNPCALGTKYTTRPCGNVISKRDSGSNAYMDCQANWVKYCSTMFNNMLAKAKFKSDKHK